MKVTKNQLICALRSREVKHACLSPGVHDALLDILETSLPAALQARVDPTLAAGMCVITRLDGSVAGLLLDE